MTIHKNLCLCLLVTETLLATGLGGHSHRVICGVLAGFLHYFWLASFFWVLLDGFQLYTVLLDVLGTEPPSSRLRWYYLLAYAAPAVIVCVSAGISPLSYGVSAFASGPGRGTCWIDMEGYQLWSFVGPASFCVLVSFAVGFSSFALREGKISLSEKSSASVYCAFLKWRFARER